MCHTAIFWLIFVKIISSNLISAAVSNIILHSTGLVKRKFQMLKNTLSAFSWQTKKYKSIQSSYLSLCCTNDKQLFTTDQLDNAKNSERFLVTIFAIAQNKWVPSCKNVAVQRLHSRFVRCGSVHGARLPRQARPTPSATGPGKPHAGHDHHDQDSANASRIPPGHTDLSHQTLKINEQLDGGPSQTTLRLKHQSVPGL